MLLTKSSVAVLLLASTAVLAADNDTPVKSGRRSDFRLSFENKVSNHGLDITWAGNALAHTTHDGSDGSEKPKEVSWFTPEHYVTTVHAQQELKISGRFADRWIIRGPSAYPDGGFRLAVQIDKEANDVDGTDGWAITFQARDLDAPGHV